MTTLNAPDIVIHIIGWLIFLSLPLLFMSGQPENSNLAAVLLSPWYWLFLFFYLFVFYTNAWLFIPQLYQNTPAVRQTGTYLNAAEKDAGETSGGVNSGAYTAAISWQ